MSDGRKIDSDRYDYLNWHTAKFRDGTAGCDHDYDPGATEDCDAGEGKHFTCTRCSGVLCVEVFD